MAQTVKNLPAMWETQVLSLGQENSLEKGMATHSSILALRVPWTEEPGELQPWGCKELDMTERLTLLALGCSRVTPTLLIMGPAPLSSPGFHHQFWDGELGGAWAASGQ